jgi:hypothetical protein
MKKRFLPYLSIFLFIAAVVFFYVAARVIASSVQTETKKSSVAVCAHLGTNHLVTIQNSHAEPTNTAAKLCDKLTIVNEDPQVRLMAFGIHDKHQRYDGVEERALDKGQSLTVTLNQAGTFKFHDHLDDSAQGTFTVN